MNHGGHAGHSGGGESFMDGGNHDHHHHGGDFGCDSMQHHHDGGHDGGHDGNQFGHEPGKITLGSLFGLNNGQHQHGFLAHLLGLDHDVHHGSGATGSHGSITYQIPFWSVALQSVTLASLLQGVRMTPAVWMLTLFMTFISWLFALHLIRHNEPIANKLIGMNRTMRSECQFAAPASAAAAAQDSPAVQPARAVAEFGSPMPGSASAAPLATRPFPQPISAPPIDTFTRRQSVPGPEVPPAVFSSAAVNVPVFNNAAARLKTMVTR